MGKLYLIGGGLFLASAVFIGALIMQKQTPVPENTQRDGVTGFGALEAPQNFFESLRVTDTEKPTTLAVQNVPNPTLNENEQAQRIASLIRSWEQNDSGTNAQTRAQAAVPVETTVDNTRRQSEQEEVSDIFNDLLGNKVTDVLDATVGNGGGNSALGTGDLWLGGYNDTTSPTTAGTSVPQNSTQEALHVYGNALGKKLKAFLLAQGDQAALLETFLKDRTNTRGLKNLTDAYKVFSTSIAEIEPPSIIRDTHERLVSSYHDIGTYLWLLQTAQNDKELMQKMLEYNTYSETVAKHHVTLVTLFKAHGVDFKSHEPGSIFTFTPPNNKGLSL